jgi:hypothetical protein
MSLIILHFVVATIGLLLLYVALFLTETDEGLVQNRLEELWINVDDLSRRSLSREAALLQQVSELLKDGLDRLFGEGLFTWKAAATSTGLSAATILLYIYVSPLSKLNHSLPIFYASIVFAGLAFAPGRFRYLTFLWIPLPVLHELIPMAIFITRRDGFMEFIRWSGVWDYRNLLIPAILNMGGVASDILFLSASRWFLRKAARLESAWKLLGMISLNACLGTVLVSPLLLLSVASHVDTARLADLVASVALIGASNITAAVISGSFLLLLSVVLVHRVFWPVISKPIYAMQRRNLVKEPRLLGGISVTCLLFAWPHNPLINVIAKIVHGN